ncbi:uncharacterized protein LOC111895193 [Lactuca sativa]|uniref:Hexosyltransferase n=1 Tax=Lactuca sativa TaxID=4236 RepID=A0A9R1VIX3_LACSA|nr:uncharacterized protein LOC111895193 [Lactuca sativa]KAJ0206189.1 hypothetical protein LSAT_V11C500259880 [Lactuca sativa]
MAKSGKGRRFIVSSIIFIAFLCTIASINELRFDHLLRFSRCALQLEDTLPTNVSSEEIRVLLGILTLPDNYHRRHFLRLIYATQPVVAGAKVDVKFVFCNLTKEDQKVLIALEIMQYNDIIILNCKENMNNGKSYTYFSSLPDMLNEDPGSSGSLGSSGGTYPPYHYVMKGDDDAYFRLGQLVESLRVLPREDLYYGYTIPCNQMNPYGHYMSGMGYLISWDIVEWLRVSDIPKMHLEGPEDKVFGDWMEKGKKGKNRHNAKWSMYNYPEPPTQCTHELWPDTVAVHLLKTQEKWIRTLKYFNATQDLKPSKLYHMD